MRLVILGSKRGGWTAHFDKAVGIPLRVQELADGEHFPVIPLASLAESVDAHDEMDDGLFSCPDIVGVEVGRVSIDIQASGGGERKQVKEEAEGDAESETVPELVYWIG